jgi:quercetin dioxygenase-like cupin family protein
MRTRIVVLSAAAVSAFLLGGGVALAGNPTGSVPTILASGTIAKATAIQASGIQFSAPANVTAIVQKFDFVGGGSSGWHMHPGLTVVTVADGSFRYHEGCHVKLYVKGQSFVEPPNTPVMVKNTSADLPGQVVAALIVPAGVAPRTNTTAPHCT